MASVILLTTGVPGCGKTYVRAARFLVDDFLINNSRGKHISNFPLCQDVIAEDVVKKLNSRIGFFGLKRKKYTFDEVRSRLVVLSPDILKLWRSEESGPWETFADCDLKYCHIAIDEIHNYVSTTSSAEYIKKWDDWLGEIRHRGCTFEGITQDIAKVNRVFVGRAGIRLELIPCEDLRDPFFKIPMMDWYELKASLTGQFHKTVVMFEKRKHLSSWKTNHVQRFCITPDYFKYYRSFSASASDLESGLSRDEQPVDYQYQQRSRISLFLWFLSRNWFNFLWRFVVAGLLIWLCFFGGLNWFIVRWLDVTKSINRSNTSKISLSSQKKSTFSSAPGVSLGEKNTQKKSDPERITSNGIKKSVKKDTYNLQVGAVSVSYKDEKDYLLQKKIEDDLKKPFKPCIFFDGSVWLVNGLKITKNFVFKSGVYNGETVVFIDSSERSYTLSNGLVVSMFD